MPLVIAAEGEEERDQSERSRDLEEQGNWFWKHIEWVSFYSSRDYLKRNVPGCGVLFLKL